VPLPLVSRCCGIFECRGDRRLNTHVLIGLYRLLPKMFAATKARERVGALFPAARDALNGTAMLLLCDPEGGPAQLVDLAGMMDEEGAACESEPSSKDFPADADERWRPLWNANATALAAYFSGKSAVPLLGYLCWRVGWECGTIVAALHKAKLSWGTYRDLMGNHCNAHTNNLVLMPEATKGANGAFLAPLDLDMAFSKAAFIYSNPAARKAAEATISKDVLETLVKKKYFRQDFESLLRQESQGMMQTLAGDDEATSGVTVFVDLPPSLEVVRTAMYDTMAKAYLAAYAGQKDLHPAKAALRNPAYALLRLALIESANEIA